MWMVWSAPRPRCGWGARILSSGVYAFEGYARRRAAGWRVVGAVRCGARRARARRAWRLECERTCATVPSDPTSREVKTPGGVWLSQQEDEEPPGLSAHGGPRARCWGCDRGCPATTQAAALMGGLSQRAVRWAWRIRMVLVTGVRVNGFVIKTYSLAGGAWGCRVAVRSRRAERRAPRALLLRGHAGGGAPGAGPTGYVQFGGRRGSSARSPSPGPGRGSPHARCAHDALARQTSDQHAPCLRGILPSPACSVFRPQS